jgi:chromosome segregation and condensation protein ScpB
LLGPEISGDTLADLLALGLIVNGSKSSGAGAPNVYTRTAEFLSRFGLNGLQDRELIEYAEIASLADAEEEISCDFRLQ